MDLDMSEDDSEEDFGEYADMSEDEEQQNGSKANGGSDDESDAEQAAESNWGKRRNAYHKTRDESDAESDEEDVAEQKEAQRLQRLKAASRRDDDFDDSFAARSSAADAKRSGKKAKALTSTDAGLLETMYKEMGTFQSSLTADADALTRQEKMEMIQKDSPELLLLLDSFNANMQEIRDRLAPLIERARAQHIPTSKGMSYLETKYHLLLNYCTNICFYLLLKAEGQSVKNHPVIEHLARTRTVIDRLKPLDQKLKYQIDKLLKVAAQGEANIQSDPKLSHRANIKGFMPVGADDEDADSMDGIDEDGMDVDDEEGHETLGSKLDKYVAPKFAPTGDREEKRRLRAEKKAKSGAMAEYLIDEFGDRPREHSLSTGPRDKSLRAAASERQTYEEDNFVRLGLTKKEKKATRAAQNSQFVDEFADLADYGDLKALDRADTLHQADDLEDRAFSAKRKRGGKDETPSKSGSRVSDILGDIDARAEASAAAKAHRYSQSADDDIDYDAIKLDKKAKRQKLKDDREKAEAQHAIDMERRAEDAKHHKEPEVAATRSKKDKRTKYGDEAAAFSDDDDFYKQAVATQEAAKAEKLAAKRAERSGRKADRETEEADKRAARDEFDALSADGKRKVTKEIEINRGLRKTKKKELRNSRVKNKNRYEDALQKLKSRGVNETHTGARRFDGTVGAINKRVVKSTIL